VEASIDFPEEDLVTDTLNQISSRIVTITVTIQDMIYSTKHSRSIREGIRTVLIGLPNVGKSSLLNVLLNRNRAIVSAKPGTTRDTIEELVEIQGLSFRLVDTAGLRDSEECLEKEGIARSKQAIETADIVLIVVEAGRPLDSEEVALVTSAGSGKALLVPNKTDLTNDSCMKFDYGLPICPVSSKTGQGILMLKKSLVEIAMQGVDMKSSSEFIVNSRQEEALRLTMACMERCGEAISNQASPELIAVDLRMAANFLGEIIGEVTTDNILDLVFSKFCIGK
jgi:tRNA modification GTPase